MIDGVPFARLEAQSRRGKEQPVSMSELQFHRVNRADAEIAVTRPEVPRGSRARVEHAIAAEAWEREQVECHTELATGYTLAGMLGQAKGQ